MGETTRFTVDRPIFDHSYKVTWWMGPGVQWPCECRRLYQFVIGADLVELHCAACKNVRRQHLVGPEHGVELRRLVSGAMQKVGMAPAAQRVG